MNDATGRLRQEIAEQLERDILDYGWLLQITKQISPDEPFEARSAMLIDALADLVNEPGVTVGPAAVVNDKVHIHNWGKTHEATIAALRRFIAQYGAPGSRIEIEFAFWVGLPA